MTNRFEGRIDNRLRVAMAGAALVAVALTCLGPISDIDFWWHLATGRYLVETKSFLTADPFGLAGANVSPGRDLILNGYWLSQILFYGIDRILGLEGIVLLRMVLLLVPPLSVLFFGWRRFPRSAVVVPLALLCGWAMLDVSGIRPNHITVALVPLLMVLLQQIGFAAEWDGCGRYRLGLAWLLPPLLLLWANLHGGFLLAAAILVLYAGSEAVTLYRRKSSLRALFGVGFAVAVALAASLLTPNGTRLYAQFIFGSGSVVQEKSSEFMSPLALATSGILIYWPFFLLLLVLALLLFCRWRRLLTTRYLLIVALAAIGLISFRYAPLSVGAVTVLLVPELQSVATTNRRRMICDLLAAVVAGGLIMAAVIAWPHKAGALAQGAVDAGRFPIAAADFIEQRQLDGITFNHFNWGGYLDWRQPGKLKTFIDGRSLSLPLFHAYTRALWLPNETQSIFDRYAVDLIVMPRLNPFTGELYALTDLLWRTPQWVLIYRDQTAMVLVRAERFQQMQQVVAIDKRQIYRDVLADINRLRLFGVANGNLAKAAQIATSRLNATRN